MKISKKKFKFFIYLTTFLKIFNLILQNFKLVKIFYLIKKYTNNFIKYNFNSKFNKNFSNFFFINLKNNLRLK